MISRDVEATRHLQRDQTDESLRAERDKSDATTAKVSDESEREADEVVRVARERADLVTQAARDEADHATSGAATVGGAGERARADVVLERERDDADGVLRDERAARKRYLADFLAAEREATDDDLVVERAHADTVIAARDEFLGTVSHDLRSLLGGLALGAALLLDEAPEGAAGDRLRTLAARSQRMVARMNRLVNDLLDVASIESGALAIFPERVHVRRALHDTLEAFEPVAAARGVALDADADAARETVWIDDGRIQQVLANLVGNAIKFTPAGGRVSITVRADGAEVVFAVTDTGIGIPAAALPTVFERFRQVNKDHRGLGLGLHISRSIVEAHGGRMWAESAIGAGSTFSFALPARPDAGASA
jgi:signal transduction histidine kinase